MLVLFQSLKGREFVIASIAYVLVLLISFTLHEYSHALVAYKSGDVTPKLMGRVTINPIAHIDPIGFLCSALFCFGWAKPVVINPNNFKNTRKGMFWTSVSGVITNFILAFISCGLYFVCVKYLPITNYFNYFVLYFFYTMYVLNISLFVFNLLPIYPLDGFNAVASLTKGGNSFTDFMYKYGNIILIIVLLFSNFIAGGFLGKLISYISYPIEWLWGLIV